MHFWYFGQSVQDERGGLVPPSWADAQWDMAGATLLRSVAASPDVSAVLLGQGDLREIRPARSLRTTLAELFGVEARGDTLADVLLIRWSEADVCLMPHHGHVHLHFGDPEPLAAMQFAAESPAGLKVLARVRSDYERLRDEWKAEALALEQLADRTADKQVADRLRERAAKVAVQHEKVLGATQQEFKDVPLELLLPEKYVDDQPRKPETSYSENFDGADKAGVGYQNTWSESEGTGWSNTSNMARMSGVSIGDHAARLDSDLSSSNHRSQINLASSTLSSGVIGCGPTVRHSASAQTFYYAYTNDQAADNQQESWRQVAGTHTKIGSTTAGLSFSGLPKQIKLEINGSSLRRYFDGTLHSTDTDANIGSNVRCGLYGFSNNASNIQEFDDFLCMDLAGALLRLQNEGLYVGSAA